MDRARLTLLAVCALLTTTLDPFTLESSTTADRSPMHSILPAVSATGSVTPVANATIESETEVFSQILERLSMRHTALPERERIALVHTIIREARVQGLDPALVIAVIEVESAGYHLAVSHVGAMGLMQLLPSTAKELAERMDVEWKGPDTLFDPTINVQLGTAYLRQLADRYGDVNIALAAYNWGPGRIDRRLRRGATVPSRYIEQVMRAVDRNTLAAVSRS